MSKKMIASVALLVTPLGASMTATAGNNLAQTVQQSLENFRGLHSTRTVESCVALGHLASDFLKQSMKLSSADVAALSTQFKEESERLDCGGYREAADFLVESKAADAELFAPSEPKDLAEIEEMAHRTDASLPVNAKFLGGVARAVGSAVGGAVLDRVAGDVIDQAWQGARGLVNQAKLADYAAVANSAGIGYMGWTQEPVRVEIGVIKPRRLAIAETTKTGSVSDTEFDW